MLPLLAAGALAYSFISLPSGNNNCSEIVASVNGDFDDECRAILQEWYKEGQAKYAAGDNMMDLDKPVIVRMGGKEVFNGKVTRSADVFRKTLYERDDPDFAFSAEITVSN